MMNTTTEASTVNHPVVSSERWIAERKKLMAREKELTHLRDQIARERRALPWERVEKEDVFDAPEGRRKLADLTDGMNVHLAHRDVTFVAISRATLAEIERFRQRMGWQFKWVSSHGNDFNYDFHVSFTPEERVKGEVYYNYATQPFEHDELPGISVFYKDDGGQVFHTYSTYRRGVEAMMGTYNLLDLTPKGRDEEEGGMHWVRHHDRYEPGKSR